MRVILTAVILAVFLNLWGLNFLKAEENDLEEIKLLISEIMYDPPGSGCDKEWVEVVNKTGEEIELEKIRKGYVMPFRITEGPVDDELKNNHPVYFEKEKLKLDDEEIFIIAKDIEIFKEDYFKREGKEFEGKVLKSSFDKVGGDFVGLYVEIEKEASEDEDKDESETIWLDKLEYSSGWGGKGNGKTLERVDYDEKNEKENWRESVLMGGTPGEKYQKIEVEYSDEIRINELLPNPEGADQGGEWVEIYYFGEEEISLAGWSLQDKSGKQYFFEEEKMGEDEYLVVEYSDSKISLNNSDEEIFLLNPLGEVVSDFSYDQSQEGLSWALDENDDWQMTPLLTPGKANQFPEKIEYPEGVIFSEIMPNPEGSDSGNEWVELFDENDFEVDLENWQIENSSGKKFTIGSEKILAGGWLAVKTGSPFTIKNSNEKLRLLDPNGEEVDKVEIIGSAKSGSSYNLDDSRNWRWSRFVTPGKANRLNQLPKIKIKKSDKVYRDIKAEFDASGTKDADGDQLKFTWDFGDGHKSYLKETSHTYDKTGKFKASLKVSDGSEEVFEFFSVEVKKYPRREMEIIQLFPNPAGKDAGAEIIEIRNNSSKKINLKDWKISTGRSEEKLTNHPIYDDISIQPGKSKTVSNEKCKFSLLNTSGAVALKYPDGKIADLVKYEKDKIGEDERYVLEENGWIWSGGLASEESLEKSESEEEFGNNFEPGEPDVEGDFSSKDREALFLEIISNSSVSCCESLGKIMLNNWKQKNEKWLALVGEF